MCIRDRVHARGSGRMVSLRACGWRRPHLHARDAPGDEVGYVVRVRPVREYFPRHDAHGAPPSRRRRGRQR
eukprot:149820-Prymnesium_polylepis.1